MQSKVLFTMRIMKFVDEYHFYFAQFLQIYKPFTKIMKFHKIKPDIGLEMLTMP